MKVQDCDRRVRRCIEDCRNFPDPEDRRWCVGVLCIFIQDECLTELRRSQQSRILLIQTLLDRLVTVPKLDLDSKTRAHVLNKILFQLSYEAQELANELKMENPFPEIPDNCPQMVETEKEE